MERNAVPSTFALLTTITLSVVMLATSPISPFGPTAAYASESLAYLEKILEADTGYGKQQDDGNRLTNGGGAINNAVNVELFQGGSNINRDNDVLVGRCDDGHIQVNDNDKVIQSNIYSANQEANIYNEDEADSDNEDDPVNRIANTAGQTATQVATNFNIDNDLILILDCQNGSIEINDNDKVIQSNIYSANQEANIYNEDEADSE